MVMEIHFSKIESDFGHNLLSPALMRRNNSQSVYISLDTANADQSNMHIKKKWGGNCYHLKHKRSPTQRTEKPSQHAEKKLEQRHCSDICLPALYQHQTSRGRNRSRSRSCNECDLISHRSRKPRCQARWKLLENVIPVISLSLKFRDKSLDTTYHVKCLNTRLLNAIENHSNTDVESLLLAGVDPNATCRVGHISACHAAAYANSDALRLLLKFHANKDRRDKFGRTPLHLAALAGDTLAIAMLLDFPIDLQQKVKTEVTSDVEEEIKTLRAVLASSDIDVTCDLAATTAPALVWKDSIEHKCKKYMKHLPKFFSGWTPLHIASYASNHGAARLLLAAGANPNSKDAMGKTPLDVAGTACYEHPDSSDVNKNNYLSTIKTIIEFGGKLDILGKIPSNSALHTAVKLSSVEAVQVLLAAEAPIWHLNSEGNTPLHECVAKFSKETLEVLAKHNFCGQSYPSVDVVNSSGYTVLHAAIFASWIPGVCVALEAGADVTFEAYDGKTALHVAAFMGNLDILDEILLKVERYGDIDHVVNYSNRRTEPPIFSAIRSGNLECVQAFLDAGALLRMSCYVEPTYGDTIISIPGLDQKPLNIILHATAELDNVEMLQLLLDHDKSLEKLFLYACPYLDAMTPVEFAAHHNRFFTFKFLLHKILEQNHLSRRTFDHSRLLHIIVTENREDLFKEFIRQIPNGVQATNGKGHYTLHAAAKDGNRNMVEQLIYNGADLSEEDENGFTAISLVINNISKSTELLTNILDNSIKPTSVKKRNGNSEIIVNYQVLIPTTVNILKNKDQLRVLTSLLNTDSQNQRKFLDHPLVESFLYLKWKRLSIYFYLMVLLYCPFVISFSVYTLLIFYEGQDDSDDNDVPVSWLCNPHNWKIMVYFTLGINFIQDLSLINLTTKSRSTKFLTIQFWLKLGTYSFAVAILSLISLESTTNPKFKGWQRYLATSALVLAWLDLMLILSKMPMLGHYVRLFWKLTIKLIKILITFTFFVMLISVCFMVTLDKSSNDPLDAVVDAFVTMTSDNNLQDIFNNKEAEDVIRFKNANFLISTAIMMMNLMIGAAIRDISLPGQEDNIKQLEKQVDFMKTLTMSKHKSFFHYIYLSVGLLWWFKLSVPQTVKIKPIKDEDYLFSSNIKQAIIIKAQEQLDHIEKETQSNELDLKFKNLTQSIVHVITSDLYLKQRHEKFLDPTKFNSKI